MNYDWNWFFSSFSQCAAALIAIIGAFVISRLLGLSEKVNLLVSDFDKLIIQYNKIRSSLDKRKFDWYTEKTVRYNDILKEEIKKGNYSNLSEIEIIEKIWVNVPNIYKLKPSILSAFHELYAIYGSFKDGRTFYSVNLEIVPVGLIGRLNTEKEAINNLEIEARTLIEQFKNNQQELNEFKDSINPLYRFIIILMIAFPLTVIYPLHFMPAYLNQYPEWTINPILIYSTILSLKNMMLFIFLVIIEILFWYFLRQTQQIKLKHLSAINNNSEEYKNIKSYSEHFDDAA
jgi:hypothetical protein